MQLETKEGMDLAKKLLLARSVVKFNKLFLVITFTLLTNMDALKV